MEEKNYSSVDDLDVAYFGNLAKDLSEEECKRIANEVVTGYEKDKGTISCLLYTSPSPRDRTRSRMPSSA